MKTYLLNISKIFVSVAIVKFIILVVDDRNQLTWRCIMDHLISMSVFIGVGIVGIAILALGMYLIKKITGK